MLTADVAPPTELGLFGPTSVTWRIAREFAVLFGSGSRALLMQVAHPKIAAAVMDHSRYRSEPVGRLRDTLGAIYGFAFDDTPTATRIVERINALHAHVYGTTPDGQPYSARDPHLLLWVYATLLDSALLAYETFVEPLHPCDRDAYYAEFVQAGSIWGIPRGDFPPSLVDLRVWMKGLLDSGEVRVSVQGRSVGRLILQPPMWLLPPPLAAPLRLSTVWLLPPSLRAGFGYSWGPRRERFMQALAASSRSFVPRLPGALRHLPIARAADRRVRAAVACGHAARERQ